MSKSAPSTDQKHVLTIPEDIWAEFAIYAKLTNCSTETAILAALSEWLGRV